MPGGRGRHGGPRTPSTPAAVSPPGADSQRTDGGPSNPSVDMAGFDAQRMGQRQQVEAMASLTGNQPPSPSRPSPSSSPRTGPSTDVFRPTEDDLPVTTPPGGVSPQARRARQHLPDDPDALLRTLWLKYDRHPDLLRLLSAR